MKICIFGLGYVYAVNLACLAKLGHKVTVFGIDIKKRCWIKCNLIKKMKDVQFSLTQI